MTKPPNTHLLQRQIDAARALRAELDAMPDMDEKTVRDTIEGETSLNDMIAAVVRDMDEDDILCEGITALVKRLSERLSRLERRDEMRRAAIQRAMEVGEIKSLPLPSGTLSLRATPRKVEVIDEIQIPPEYWVPQPARLDRKAVADALKDGKTVAGVMLSNGGTTLSIRRS